MLPVLYDPNTAVPDVVGLSAAVSAATKTAAIWWNPALQRSTTLFPASCYTGEGLVGLDPWMVSDSEISRVAFTWLAGAGTSRLKFFDAGGRSFRGCRVTVDTSIAPVTQPSFERSADGSSWTPVTATLVQTIVSGNLTTYVYEWADVGSSPPHWSVYRPSGTNATAVTEVMFLEYGALYDDVAEIRVFDVASGSRSLCARVLPANQPTSSNRLSVTQVMTWAEAASSDTGTVSVVVVVVNSRGQESAGVAISLQDIATVLPPRFVTSVGGIVGNASGEVSIAQVAGTLAARDSMTAIGGRAVVGATASTRLAASLSAGATSISVESNIFASGHVALLQKVVGATLQTEYLSITSAASGSGPYTYSVTRNQDGSGADAWDVGDAVVGLGQAGNGFVEVYAARGLKSATEVGPAIAFNVRNSGTWNDWTPRAVVGNLRGTFGYGAVDIFGAAFGVPSAAWVKIDPTNGIRIGHNATTKVSIDASGNASFNGAITAESGSIGGWTIDASSLTGGGILIESFGDGKIAVGGPHEFDNAATEFYVDGDGNFSLGDSLVWDGSTLTITGVLSAVGNLGVAGNVSASSGDLQIHSIFANGDINADFIVAAGTSLEVAGNQVVGPRGAAVANATGAGDIVAQFNTLLARLRAHGLIAT